MLTRAANGNKPKENRQMARGLTNKERYRRTYRYMQTVLARLRGLGIDGTYKDGRVRATFYAYGAEPALYADATPIELVIYRVWSSMSNGESIGRTFAEIGHATYIEYFDGFASPNRGLPNTAKQPGSFRELWQRLTELRTPVIDIRVTGRESLGFTTVRVPVAFGRDFEALDAFLMELSKGINAFTVRDGNTVAMYTMGSPSHVAFLETGNDANELFKRDG